MCLLLLISVVLRQIYSVKNEKLDGPLFVAIYITNMPLKCMCKSKHAAQDQRG